MEPFIAEASLPGIRWVARDLKPPIFQQAAELFAQGASVREVKQALGLSHGEAGRLRLRAAAEGLLEAGKLRRTSFQVELRGVPMSQTAGRGICDAVPAASGRC